MSREIRRVPTDFDWPLNKVWDGYLMPAELRLPQCPDCSGSGSTAAFRWLTTFTGRLGMLAEDVRRPDREMHPWLSSDPNPPTRTVYRPITGRERQAMQDEIDRCEARGEAARGWIYRDLEAGVTRDGEEILRPSSDIVELVEGLGASNRGFGFSTTDSWKTARIVIAAAGLPETWGQCPTCDGTGEVASDELRGAHDSWERTEPPTGDGWQLWETVSEGSPISSVFADREDLIAWLTTDYTWGGQKTPLSRPQAEAFVGLGHSIGSGIITSGGTAISGEAAVYELRKQ